MIIKIHPTFKFALIFSAFFLRGFLFSQNSVLELLPGSEPSVYPLLEAQDRSANEAFLLFLYSPLTIDDNQVKNLNIFFQVLRKKLGVNGTIVFPCYNYSILKSKLL